MDRCPKCGGSLPNISEWHFANMAEVCRCGREHEVAVTPKHLANIPHPGADNLLIRLYEQPEGTVWDENGESEYLCPELQRIARELRRDGGETNNSYADNIEEYLVRQDNSRNAPTMNKPVILTDSLDDAECFDWQSVGWYQFTQRGTPQAEALFAKADKCIDDGTDVPDVIKRLTDAGFTVRRVPRLTQFPLGPAK
jgi:hypothetical protein